MKADRKSCSDSCSASMPLEAAGKNNLVLWLEECIESTSQNHLGWTRPSTSLNPTANLIYQVPPLTDVSLFQTSENNSFISVIYSLE